LGIFGLAVAAAPAQAEFEGAPRPWQLGFREPVTPVFQNVILYHDWILVLITAITLLVLGLILFACWRFRESRNPTPSRTSHNTPLEILWTTIPALILIAMVIPSLHLLYAQEVPPDADLRIKATGNQWYWSYEYPEEEIAFEALMLSRDEVASAGLSDSLWKLATDNAVVVPVDSNVLVEVTASDVIHAWTIPEFGSKVDAIPGRLNQTWFNAERIGTYYGQCSELCGSNHAFMPIVVRVVSMDDYRRWLVQAKEEFASVPDEGRFLVASE